MNKKYGKFIKLSVGMLVLSTLIYSEDVSDRLPNLILHRQSPRSAPENTWAAIKQAVLWGAARNTTLEIDLAKTKDGKIFLFHDDSLEGKNEEIRGRSNDFLWEEINDIDFGSWFDPKFKTEYLPLFEDVIKFCKLNGIRLVLDHLNPENNVSPDRTSSGEVIDILNKHNAIDIVYFQMGGSIPIGQDIGPSTWMNTFDGDRESLRSALKQGWGSIWLDDARVVMDLLNRYAPKQEQDIKMPTFISDYSVEELNFATLVAQLRTGGDQGRIAASRLRKHFKKQASKEFISILNDVQISSDVKTITAKAFGRAWDEQLETDVSISTDAKSSLNTLLTSTFSAVRASAAYALGKLKDKQSVPQLMELLKNRNESEDVRIESTIALGRISSTSALSLLIEITQEEKNKTINTLIPYFSTTVAQIGSHRAIPNLMINNYHAIGKIGGADALNFLLSQYSSTPSFKVGTMEYLLEHIFVRFWSVIPSLARTGSTQALASVKDSIWSPYVLMGDFTLFNKYFSHEVFIPVVFEFFEHPNLVQRQEAFYTLLRIGTPAILPLINLLNNIQASPVSREWAAWTLGWIYDTQQTAIPSLINALSDTNPGVRAKAVWSMGKLKISSSVDKLFELTKDTDSVVRLYATEAIERIKGLSLISSESEVSKKSYRIVDGKNLDMSLSLSSRTFSKDVFISISTNPLLFPESIDKKIIEDAINKIENETSKNIISSTIIEINIYDLSGKKSIELFLKPAILIMAYSDVNNDGIVDGTSVKEELLKIFTLDETEKRWKVLDGKHTIDKQNNKVSVEIMHSSIFAMMDDVTTSTLSNVIVYPNPYRTTDGIVFEKLSNNIKIKIYNIGGELIYQNETTNTNGRFRWFAINNNGNKVASGIYIYHIINSDNMNDKKIGKLAIIH